MNILLVYPETPPTFWNFQEVLSFVSKKSSEPPLGLLTVAALLPEEWGKELVDLNVGELEDRQIRRADFVFLGGMNVHRSSFRQVIERCHRLGTPVVAGGPLATTEYSEFPEVDYFVLNEAEITLPMFIDDVRAGRSLRPVYRSEEFPDIRQSPIPMWNLLDRDQYSGLNLQYSRGCPFDCEFCGIAFLNGKKVRTKTAQQFLAELESLYEWGWRGEVFVVDDNFIGNKVKLKRDVLPLTIDWQRERGYPFQFTTEVSINLADDIVLISQLVEAGFEHVFVGIETVNDASLQECGKSQNRMRDTVSSVKRLQSNGLIVSAGFIIGFDNDTADIFDIQTSFIEESGIPVAMVGLLNAPTGSRLFRRMGEEKRLKTFMSGDNMDGSLNFVPKLDEGFLRNGYRKLVTAIYSPSVYFKRLRTFFSSYKLPGFKRVTINADQFKALFRAFWILGIRDEARLHFWRLFFSCLIKSPRKIVLAVTMAVFGLHFRKVAAAISR